MGLKISHISGKLILVDIKEINFNNLESFFLTTNEKSRRVDR